MNPRRTLLSRTLLALTAVCLLLALGAGRRPLAAQGDGLIGDDAYESPNFGYELEWSNDWQVDEESTVSDENGDSLTLLGEAAYVVVLGVAFEGPASDATAAIVGSRQEGGAEVEVLDEGSGDDLAYAVIGYELDGTSYGEYVEARTVDSGVAVVSLTTTVDVFEEQVSLALETIAFDGDPLFASLQGGDGDGGDRDDEDADREEEDEDEPSRDDEDEDDGEDADERDREEDESDDEDSDDEDSDDDERSGGGESYTSPTFGYSLEWDGDVWTVEEEFSEDFDRLLLTDGASLLYVEGVPAYDGDPDDCLEDQVDILAQSEGVEEIDEVREDDGLPLSGNDDAVYVLVSVTFDDGTEYYEYLECQELVPDEAVLIVTLLTTPDAFADEAEAVAEILETLELEDAD
jgi:hypothetical protein